MHVVDVPCTFIVSKNTVTAVVGCAQVGKLALPDTLIYILPF